MANKRNFAYYMKGGNICLIEKNNNSAEQSYESPTASIDQGIEIQYSYSPIFNKTSSQPNYLSGQSDGGLTKFIGYGSDGENLVLFTFGTIDVWDISSIFTVGSWIYIDDSGRWSGLHKVKSVTAKGILTLETKFRNSNGHIVTKGTFSNDETFTVSAAIPLYLSNMEALKSNLSKDPSSYIWIEDADSQGNKGFFKVEPAEGSGKITFIKRYTHNSVLELIESDASIATFASDTVTIFQAFYDPMKVYGGGVAGLEVMEDESFELDIDRYQANSIVFYLKHKMAEEMGEIDLAEYFLNKFKQSVEGYHDRRSVSMRHVFAPSARIV